MWYVRKKSSDAIAIIFDVIQTCRRDGKIQAWNILNGDVVSSSDLNTEVLGIS